MSDQDKSTLDGRLIEALRKNDREAAGKAIEAGANPNSYCAPNTTLLLMLAVGIPRLAVKEEQSSVAMEQVLENVRFLIQHGADVNFANLNGTILSQLHNAMAIAHENRDKNLLGAYTQIEKVLVEAHAREQAQTQNATLRAFFNRMTGVSVSLGR